MKFLESNLFQRVTVAAAAIPIIMYSAYLGTFWFFIFVTSISVLASIEFLHLAEAKGASPQRYSVFAAAVLFNLAFFHEQLQFTFLPYAVDKGIGISLLTKLQLLLTIFLLLITVMMLIELFRNKGSAMENIGYTLTGMIYVGFFFSTLIGIRELFGTEFPFWLAQKYIAQGGSSAQTVYSWGGLTIISVFASIWMCDTAGYFGGMAMGKNKLFPRVSPKKTWEGAVCGFSASVATMIAAKYFILPYAELHQAVFMGVIIGSLGQLGDLVESLMKRDAGVKDSSGLIPGHGGVFDRFDSLLFVSPMLYLYIDFVILS